MEGLQNTNTVEKESSLQKIKNAVRALSVFAAVIAGTAESSNAYAEGVRAPGVDIITGLYGEEHTDAILSGKIKITTDDVAKIREYWEQVKPESFDKTNVLTEHVLNSLEGVAVLQFKLHLEELKLSANVIILEMEALKHDPDAESKETTKDDLQKKLNAVMEEIVILTPEEGDGL